MRDSEHLAGQVAEEMIDALGTLQAGEVGSPVFEMYRAAIQAELAERLAAPRRMATIAVIAAVVSALAAVASAIAAF